MREFENTGNVTSKVKKRIFTNKYKGVKQVSRNSWRARISIDGKRINLGCFPTEYEAHLTYKKALIKIAGMDYATEVQHDKHRTF